VKLSNVQCLYGLCDNLIISDARTFNQLAVAHSLSVMMNDFISVASSPPDEVIVASEICEGLSLYSILVTWLPCIVAVMVLVINRQEADIYYLLHHVSVEVVIHQCCSGCGGGG
jgi:hypothetical protein